MPNSEQQKNDYKNTSDMVKTAPIVCNLEIAKSVSQKFKDRWEAGVMREAKAMRDQDNKTNPFILFWILNNSYIRLNKEQENLEEFSGVLIMTFENENLMRFLFMPAELKMSIHDNLQKFIPEFAEHCRDKSSVFSSGALALIVYFLDVSLQKIFKQSLTKEQRILFGNVACLTSPQIHLAAPAVGLFSKSNSPVDTSTIEGLTIQWATQREWSKIDIDKFTAGLKKHGWINSLISNPSQVKVMSDVKKIVVSMIQAVLTKENWLFNTKSIAEDYYDEVFDRYVQTKLNGSLSAKMAGHP